MLPERLKKGQYLVRDHNTAKRVVRIKKHPEYVEERTYVLEGRYGATTRPYDRDELHNMGYTKAVSAEELNELFREGKYLPRDGILTLKGHKI